ncbi:hypothetical protein ACE2AJ_10745 [Aquihabitans daechungensis]|uniref:hypothetical protein n=1 Tax=Aquihabitans daechungensis TaxID=1052257 RepID=UPI003BA3D3BC
MRSLRQRRVRHLAPIPGVRPSRGESGATLLIAVAFVTVIFSLVIALLGFAQVGARSNRAYKGERTNRSSVEGAMNAGIQYLAINPTLGVSGSTDTCRVQVSIEGDVRIVVGNAYYTMECAATTPSTGGASADSGKVVDGVQVPRDVTIRILCGNDSANPVRVGYSSCGTGVTRLVATARVRFDRDTTPNIPPDKSAIIPKILNWELRT